MAREGAGDREFLIYEDAYVTIGNPAFSLALY